MSFQGPETISVGLAGGATLTVQLQGPEDVNVRTRTDPTNYNALVVILDDMGPEYFDWTDVTTGVAKAITPRLSAVANAGLILDRFYAHPTCGPTRACIQTGRVPHRTKFGANTQIASPEFELPLSEVGIAEAIRDGRGNQGPAAAYLRAIFGKWHLCHPTSAYDLHPRNMGFNRGIVQMANAGGNPPEGDLDHFIYSRNVFTLTTQSRSQIGNVSDYVAEDAPILGGNTSYDTDTNWNAYQNAHDLVTYLNSQTKPWIAFLTFNAPHQPCQVPPFAFLSAGTIAELASHGITRQGTKVSPAGNFAASEAVFRAAMEGVDTQFGYVLDNLTSLSRTNVFVCGDNGTDGELVTSPFTAQHGKRTVYEQGIRTPAFVFGPAVGAPGRRSSHLVQAVDVWNTVLDLTGTQVQYTGVGNRTIDGISFFPLIRNPEASQARSFVWTHAFQPNGTYPSDSLTSERRGLRDAEGWKYVWRYEGLAVTEELYYLPDDEFEAVDLIDAGPLSSEAAAALARLQAQAAAILAST